MRQISQSILLPHSRALTFAFASSRLALTFRLARLTTLDVGQGSPFLEDLEVFLASLRGPFPGPQFLEVNQKDNRSRFSVKGFSSKSPNGP